MNKIEPLIRIFPFSELWENLLQLVSSFLDNVSYSHCSFIMTQTNCAFSRYLHIKFSSSYQLDNCGGCPYGQVCVDTGIRCITEPCPTFRCVANDSCGGCPPWTKCEILIPPCPICVDRPRCIRPKCSPVPTCVDIPVSVSLIEIYESRRIVLILSIDKKCTCFI